jgi:LPS sulfotransferase NodH
MNALYLRVRILRVSVTSPQQGDVVVREDTLDRRRVYVMYIAPGAGQYVVQSREDAVAQAVAFAKRQQVRAWLTDGDRDFTLLEDFRADESV